MLELSLGGYPLHLPTKELEASVRRLIDTNLFEQPEVNQFWNPVNYSRKSENAGDTYPIETPNWPAPPKLRLNQLYWPVTGASRFAYGYFVMLKSDYESLRNSETAAPTFLAKDLVNNTQLSVKMYPLSPRVLIDSVGDSIESIYIFPLVDERFFWQFQPYNTARTIVEDWRYAFELAKTDIETHKTVAIDTSAQAIFSSGSSAMLYPDRLSILEGWNPVGRVVDAMMTSTGFRFVCLPNSMRISAPPSAYNPTSGSLKIGGGSIRPRVPEQLVFRYWNCETPVLRTVNRPGSFTSEFFSDPAWKLTFNSSLNTSNSTLANAYFDALGERFYNWCYFEYDNTFSGIQSENITSNPTENGSQDCFLYSLGCLSEFEHAERQATTRITSLAPWSYSNQVLVSTDTPIPTGIHFKFRLLENLSNITRSAPAQVQDLAETISPFIETVYDSVGMFRGIEQGTRGICARQACKLFIVIPECDTDSSNPPFEEPEEPEEPDDEDAP